MAECSSLHNCLHYCICLCLTLLIFVLFCLFCFKFVLFFSVLLVNTVCDCYEKFRSSFLIHCFRQTRTYDRCCVIKVFPLRGRQIAWHVLHFYKRVHSRLSRRSRRRHQVNYFGVCEITKRKQINKQSQIANRTLT